MRVLNGLLGVVLGILGAVLGVVLGVVAAVRDGHSPSARDPRNEARQSTIHPCRGIDAYTLMRRPPERSVLADDGAII